MPGEESELRGNLMPLALPIPQQESQTSLFPVPHSNVEPGLAQQPSSVSPPLTLSHVTITPKAASCLLAEGSRWLRE